MSEYNDVINELNEKYKNVRVIDIADEGSGSMSMKLAVGEKELAYLESNSPISPLFRASSSTSTITRDPLQRGDLDIVEKSVLRKSPADLFKTSINHYYVNDIYGTVVRNLANFASNGFDNDIDDEEIRSFFDNWGFDTGLDVVVEQIFFDFFRTGMVRTYKVLGKYEPQVNIFNNAVAKTRNLDGAESAARKKRWSKKNIPIKYTVLNPTMLEISGSMLFDQTTVVVKAEALKDLRELLESDKSKLSQSQKDLLKTIPPDMKKAAIKNEPYALDMSLVGEIDYRRQPYERYPKPRGVNAFESIEYKNKLRNADLSTLDGVINQILLITVGNDQFPCTSTEALENVADMFNTPSKAFDIVYNHTLNIQKIVSPEIEAILGQDKYLQVNEDITGSLGFPRVLIDGRGELSKDAARLAMTSVISEVAYARQQVKRWLYNEYRQVAEAMGFDRYPVVRFNDLALRNETAVMEAVRGMIDRRIMSYETGMKKLGLDAATEMSRLSREMPKVLDGSFGIIGSPYNPKVTPFVSDTNDNNPNVQPTQRTPSGTPSEGRPPTGAEEPANAAKIDGIADSIGKLTQDEVEVLLTKLNKY